MGSTNSDTDADGWSNQGEYFFGSLPLVSTNRPAAVSGKMEMLSVSGQTNSYFVFTCTRSSESGDVDYLVQFSPDLLTWSLTGVYLDGVDNGNGTFTERWRYAQPASNTGKLFTRLRAQFK